MMTRDEYVDLLKSTALDLGTRLVIEYIVTRAPFFKLPFFNFFLSHIVQEILRIAIKQTELGAFFMYIDLRTHKQGVVYEAAALKNKLAQESGTDEEKRLAEENLINSFRMLAKLTT